MQRPILATLAMEGGLSAVAAADAGMPAWVALGVKVAVGVVIYTTSLLALCQTEGRIDEAERWMLDRLRTGVARVGG